jgi:hypothetical protein
MEYRLTFPTLVIGSLAVCLSILATAWALDWLRRNSKQFPYGDDRNDLEPGGGGRRPSGRPTWDGPRPCPVEVFDGPRSLDIELGRARRGEARRAPLRRVG